MAAVTDYVTPTRYLEVQFNGYTVFYVIENLPEVEPIDSLFHSLKKNKRTLRTDH